MKFKRIGYIIFIIDICLGDFNGPHVWAERVVCKNLTYFSIPNYACLFSDQAALHGPLERVRDLNLTLLSVISGGPAHRINEIRSSTNNWR